MPSGLFIEKIPQVVKIIKPSKVWMLNEYLLERMKKQQLENGDR
jgi:hypothetical protein